MPATPLTAHECVLLEHYTSLDYYRRLRDTWEAMVKHVETLLERYEHRLPDGYRRRPLPRQPDVVWGQHVLPNFRDTLQDLYEGYIQFSHGDWAGWGGDRVTGDWRGQSDFWPGWMDEIEPGATNKYYDLISIAAGIAGNINTTSGAYWLTGRLSTRYDPSDDDFWTPPTVWPRYRLNPDVRVSTGEPVLQAGLYWPEAPDAAVQFLEPSQPDKPWMKAPEACVGLDESGVQYDHKEPTVWIKVERVPGETVSDGLANLLAPEAPSPHNVPAGQPCPRSGWWFTPAKPDSQRYFNRGDLLPAIPGSAYGATFWQWSPDQRAPKLT